MTRMKRRTSLLLLALVCFFFINVVSAVKHADFKKCSQVFSNGFCQLTFYSRVSAVAIVTSQLPYSQILTITLHTLSPTTYLFETVSSQQQS